MALKRCKNCNRGYSAKGSGRIQYLCYRCSADCDEAFPVILAFLQKNQMPFRLVDKDAIAEATGISPVFIWVLAKEGVFGELTQKHCNHCHKPLQPEEREICQKCALIISQQLQIALMSQKAIEYAKPPKDTDKKKYGLGRKDT